MAPWQRVLRGVCGAPERPHPPSPGPTSCVRGNPGSSAEGPSLHLGLGPARTPEHLPGPFPEGARLSAVGAWGLSPLPRPPERPPCPRRPQAWQLSCVTLSFCPLAPLPQSHTCPAHRGGEEPRLGPAANSRLPRTRWMPVANQALRGRSEQGCSPSPTPPTEPGGTDPDCGALPPEGAPWRVTGLDPGTKPDTWAERPETGQQGLGARKPERARGWGNSCLPWVPRSVEWGQSCPARRVPRLTGAPPAGRPHSEHTQGAPAAPGGVRASKGGPRSGTHVEDPLIAGFL